MDRSKFNNISVFMALAKKRGYRIFNNSQQYNLNIWCIRSKNRLAGRYDDLMVVFWKNPSNKWDFEFFDITTDPSEIALFEMKNKLGTAIVAQGQYPAAWKFGLHRGKYKALVQRGNLKVVRDYNKDSILNIPAYDVVQNWNRIPSNSIDAKFSGTRYIEKYISNGKLAFMFETGFDFGINCHRASAWRITDIIGLYSEGCIVHKDVNIYNKVFIPLIEKAVDYCGNSFTLTMTHEEEY